ncbi:MAG: DinB/UmuC family translesion DNA polymerase [Verrucomicrobiota bacterium]
MFAAVFIPDFSLQAVLRRDPDLSLRPVALVDAALPKPNIVQLTNAARARGVVEGLTPSQSMARCAELRIESRSLAQEQIATDALLQTAYAFSPNIESTAPGVCTLELKGLGLNSRDALQSWAQTLFQVGAGLNFDAQIGIAATPALALLAASAIPQSVAQNSQSAAARVSRIHVVIDSLEFVSALPIAALAPAPEIFAILERWGIRTAGALLKLGKTALVERLGPAAAELLDRVSPHNGRPLKLVTPRQVFEEQIEFETEIETFEPLLFVLRRFVEQLARRMEVLHQVVAEIHLQLKLSSGATYEQHFKIPSPTGNVETLFRMLHTHLENVRTDTPIVALRLEAKPCSPETHQFGLFETTLKNPNQFAETLARLTALCGADHVGTPILEATHRPDAFRMSAPEFDRKSAPAELQEDSATKFLPGKGSGLQLRRFRPVVPAFIEFREQRPTLLRSAVFNGALADLRGPFFSSGDWWDRQQWSREEWDVQAPDGVMYRVFRSADGCFVEGVYD